VDVLAPYRRVWLVDFEFTAPPGERPLPLCCVARELRTRRLERLWLTDEAPADPPYGTGADSLFVAYYASAELGCHLALGWPTPLRILDLYAEFRCLRSGLPVPCGYGLLGALAFFGVDGLDAVEKEGMRQLAMRGGPYDAGERAGLLDYCQGDVDALARLLPRMLPRLDLPRALLRGRYMAAAARMEWTGVPIDVEALHRLRQGWNRIKGQLIAEVDRDYGVFVPTGQRVINPATAFGAAVLAEAGESGIDPHRLAEAAAGVWEAEREATKELAEARRAARKATGLTARRIDQWEDSGRDYSEYPGLDEMARDVMRSYPALGAGESQAEREGEEATDFAGRLWDVLRRHDEALIPRHHPNILRRAAELVLASREDDGGASVPMTFSADRFAAYLGRKGIPWPRLPSGALALDDDTFREMARAYPREVGPIRELRHALSQMRLHELAVGSDGRNRVLLSPFGSRTGRNQPSNSRFIFGPATWLRSLIRPGPGRAVAYVDWSQQELATAAALSGDQHMREAYVSGDFYLTFARMAGAVPATATKKTHAAERDQFKTVALGVLYGLSAEGLARKLNVPPCHGRELLRLHQQTFRQFWEWSDRVEMEAMLTGRLRTVFGWAVYVPPGLNPETGRPLANPRSFRNFPMQGNGAEMLRLACCLATERGISVCAPVHDALLVEGPEEDIEDVVARTQAAMQEASGIVLGGFRLRTDAKVIRHPDRYVDDRGRQMWETVCALLADLRESEPLAPVLGVGVDDP
jgi:DNA polymerase family A